MDDVYLDWHELASNITATDAVISNVETMYGENYHKLKRDNDALQTKLRANLKCMIEMEQLEKERVQTITDLRAVNKKLVASESLRENDIRQGMAKQQEIYDELQVELRGKVEEQREMKVSIVKLKEERDQLKDENSNLSSQLMKAAQDAHSKHVVILELTGENQEKQSMIDMVESQRLDDQRKHQQIVNQLQHENQRLQHECTEMKCTHGVMNEELRSAVRTVEVLRKENASILNALHEEQERNKNDLESNLNGQKQQFVRILQDAEACLKKLNQQNVELKGIVSVMLREQETSQKEIEQLKEENMQLLDAKQEKTSKWKEKRERMSELRAELKLNTVNTELCQFGNDDGLKKCIGEDSDHDKQISMPSRQPMFDVYKSLQEMKEQVKREIAEKQSESVHVQSFKLKDVLLQSS